jgi:hypothetical protein
MLVPLIFFSAIEAHLTTSSFLRPLVILMRWQAAVVDHFQHLAPDNCLPCLVEPFG